LPRGAIRHGSGEWRAQPPCARAPGVGRWPSMRMGGSSTLALIRADGTRRWHATHDTRPLRALTDWLDRSGRHRLAAQMSGPVPPVGADRAGLGDAPFDPAGTLVERDPRHAKLWIRGGRWLRTLFADPPEAGARARQEPADLLAGGMRMPARPTPRRHAPSSAPLPGAGRSACPPQSCIAS
jgi:hypothetical protein